jgi:hypothetical protein
MYVWPIPYIHGDGPSQEWNTLIYREEEKLSSILLTRFKTEKQLFKNIMVQHL